VQKIKSQQEKNTKKLDFLNKQPRVAYKRFSPDFTVINRIVTNENIIKKTKKFDLSELSDVNFKNRNIKLS
jgi:hypothetical protein